MPAPGATEFSGVGNDVVSLVGYDLTRTIMVVTHNGVANFELATLDQDLNQIALVESTIGAMSGTYPLERRRAGATELPASRRRR